MSLRKVPLGQEKIKFIISVAREYRKGSLAMVSEELSETHSSDSYTKHNLAKLIESSSSEEHAMDSCYNDLKNDKLQYFKAIHLIVSFWLNTIPISKQ